MGKREKTLASKNHRNHTSPAPNKDKQMLQSNPGAMLEYLFLGDWEGDFQGLKFKPRVNSAPGLGLGTQARDLNLTDACI